MKSFTKLGLAQRLTLSTFFMMAGGLIFLTALVYFSVITFGQEFLIEELDERTSIIERTITEPLWNYDRTQLVEMGHSLLLEGKYIYVTGLKVQYPNGEVLFEKGPGRVAIDFNQVKDASYTKSRVSQIYREGQLIGIVSVAVTNQGFVTTFSHQLLKVLAFSLGLLVFVSLMLRFYFNRALTIPLNRVLNQIHMFETNQFDQGDISDLPEEFEVISNALSSAWKLVKQRNDDLLVYADDLEKVVKERTSELEGQIAKNVNAARLVAAGEMAADVAHEINNPLTIIDLHVAKIKKLGMDEGKTISHHEIRQSVDKIQSMVVRITKIIKGLKSIARDGNTDPMIPFNVQNMLEEVKALVEMKIKGQDIKFKVTLNDSEAMVIGREVQISQVLVNLINNSVDAIAQLPEKWVTLDIRVSDKMIRFILTDSGQGIPEDLQEKIMRPFFTTKAANKGTGLGLSISKNIIQEHEGQFLYNCSSPNTQFIFTLRRYANQYKMSA